MLKIPKTLAERLSAARARTGLSAKALDREAGLTEGHTTLIESGRRPNIEAGTAAKLALALDISIDWLVTGKGRGPDVARAS